LENGKLFEERNPPVLHGEGRPFKITSLDHVRREELDDFAEGHLVVIIRVDLG